VQVTESWESLHGLELELGKGDILVIRFEDDGFGAYVELSLVLILGFVGGEIVKRAISEEILYVNLVFLHVVKRKALYVGGRNEQHRL
jgi:hypothetical protein